MGRSPIDIAIDQMRESADGDIRLALRTVLLQNVELQLKIQRLTEKVESIGTPQNSKSLN